MPTYQYACRTCDHRFEAVQGFHEEALRVCPECEAEDLRKLFGNVGVVFKGSGFYRTDSRSNGKAGGSGKPKTDSGAPSTSSSAAAGTAPAPSSSASAAKPSASTSGAANS